MTEKLPEGVHRLSKESQEIMARIAAKAAASREVLRLLLSNLEKRGS